MFNAPIQLLNKDECLNLAKTTIDDLQLDLLYEDLLGEETQPEVRNAWVSHYTTNTDFLKNSQLLLNHHNEDNEQQQKFLEIQKNYLEIKGNPSFREKYEYITIDFFEKLNSSPHILQMISMYSLTSPLLSLLTPFIMLIIPFFILRVRGSSIGMGTYLAELKKVLSMLPIGKLFTMGNSSLDQRGFILFSAILYIVQIYQNSITCFKFYKNSHKMVRELHEFGEYMQNTADRMREFIETCDNLELQKYTPFCDILREKIMYYETTSNEFLSIQANIFRDMGAKMKYYYDIYCNETFAENIEYSFCFHDYANNLCQLSNIGFNSCTFSKKHTSFTKSYHGILRNSNPIKNSFKLTDNNIILSGPNASGKTTLLKSTVINIILSQQIGMGFFDKAKIKPYHSIHCYINIPDTCDRDSLFQAEARRCREILSDISKHPNKHHLCVFDELFSGTNPYEAVAGAVGYLEYLNKNKNVKFMLTTHYLDLCNHFEEKNTTIKNYTLERKYVMAPGISKIRGGIAVLEELMFPEEILMTAKKWFR